MQKFVKVILATYLVDLAHNVNRWVFDNSVNVVNFQYQSPVSPEWKDNAEVIVVTYEADNPIED